MPAFILRALLATHQAFRLIAVVTILSTSSNTQASHSMFENVDESVAYENPLFSITTYEAKKRFGQFLDASPSRLKLEEAAVFEQWNDWFTEYVTLLREAYTQGYDQSAKVEEIVDSMARFLIAQKDTHYLKIIGETYVANEQTLRDRYDDISQSGPIPPFEQIKASLREHDEHQFIMAAIRRTEERLVLELSLQIDVVAANALASIVSARPKPRHEIRPDWIEDVKNDPIARYSIAGKSQTLDIAEFTRRYNLLPMRYAVDNTDSVVAYARRWAFGDWLWIQAEEKGLIARSKFQQDRIAYLRDTMILEMIRAESERRFPITREILQAAFNDQKERMSRNEEVRGRLYHFDDRMEAFNTYKQLTEGGADSLASPFENAVIDANSDNWPENAWSAIALAPAESALPPVVLNDGKIVVLLVEEITRSAQLAFEDAQDDLKAELVEKHLASSRMHILESARSASPALDETLTPALGTILSQRRENAESSL